MSKIMMPNKFTLTVVILFGAIVNWFSYQFAKDYAGPITATSVILLLYFNPKK